MAGILSVGLERAASHMKIEAKHLVRTFGPYLALDNVSLKIEEGELVALLGPSGSGKTTLLRIFAGLDFPDTGSVLFDDQDATRLRIQTRQVGFVFQNYALFRHMTIYKNIAFGLEVARGKDRLKPALIRERVFELLRLVQLVGFENRLPAQLSGGQRQRVALARALAIEPRVLLLDEPFGALDAMVRKELRSWVKQLQRQLKITTLFVTHDQDEAIEIADRIVVMNTGRIEQVGTPSEVCEEPATPFVWEFLQGQATSQEFRSCRISSGPIISSAILTEFLPLKAFSDAPCPELLNYCLNISGSWPEIGG
jgi:sulfate/thiosulfate transport system ATP-binding protein